jgi:uncharacterized membrane protein (UPF0127 family)
MITGEFKSADNRWTIPTVFQTQGLVEANKGLLKWPILTEYQGMWIKINAPSKVIHTFKMKYPIDLVYLNKRLEVVKLVEDMHPGTMSCSIRAYSTVELKAGGIQKYGIQLGDQAQWIASS